VSEHDRTFEESVLRSLSADLAADPGWHPDWELLMDYVAGELPAAIRDRLRAHEIRCPSCRRRAVALRKTYEETISTFQRAVSPWTFGAYYEARLAREQRFGSRFAWRRLAPALAAGACAVGMLSLSLTRMLARPGLVARGLHAPPEALTWTFLGLAGVFTGIALWLMLRGRR